MHGYRRYKYQAGYTLFSPLFASDMATNSRMFPTSPFSAATTVPATTAFRSTCKPTFRASAWCVNYTLSSAETWGCVLGELFDYVNGVCNPLNAFAKGDYGPSGENVTDRLVLAGTVHLPGGFELSFLSQAESARPFTLTTPVDVNGFGDTLDDRAVVNGVQTGMDQFRGTPYIQTDMRVSRPFRFHEHWQADAVYRDIQSIQSQ